MLLHAARRIAIMLGAITGVTVAASVVIGLARRRAASPGRSPSGSTSPAWRCSSGASSWARVGRSGASTAPGRRCRSSAPAGFAGPRATSARLGPDRDLPVCPRSGAGRRGRVDRSCASGVLEQFTLLTNSFGSGGVEPGVTPARCERSRQAISLRLDGMLSAFESALLDRHLRGCPSCRSFAIDAEEQTRLLRSALLEQPTRSGPGPLRVGSRRLRAAPPAC